MPDDLTETITDAAQEPAEAAGDGHSVKSRTIDEMIAADQYAKAQTAVTGTNDQGGPKSPWGCLRPARVVLPGSQ